MGLVQLGGGGVTDFYAGGKGAQIYAQILNSQLGKGVGEEVVSKKRASQRGGSGESEHGLPPFAPALLFYIMTSS